MKTRMQLCWILVNVCLVTILTGWTGILSAQARNTSTYTNFVVILVDDLGWNDLGCYGSKFYETPNLDAFAQTAVRFTDAYAAGSVCSPTRAALMTGRYPPRVNITDWIKGRGDRNQKLETPQIDHQLALDQVTLAETLKSQGYRTCFAGKWHLGSKGYYPEDQGFELNYGGHRLGSPPGGYYAPWKNPKLPNGPDGEYLPDRLTRESIKFMEQNRDKPFLLYLSFYTVHTPIQACRRHLPRFQKKRQALPELDPLLAFAREHDGWSKQRQDNAAYASMVYAMDENVGRILKSLKRLELDQNTVVMFTSDNGGLCTLPRKSAPTALRPLRAGKGWLYEGGIRVPLIIRIPNVTKAGSVTDLPTISMDLFETVAALATEPADGVEHQRTAGDGVNLVPFLTDTAIRPKRELYWHYPHYHGSAWKPGAAIRDGDWKLIRFYETDSVELYHLKHDLSEQHNLAEKEIARKDALMAKLKEWQRTVGAKLPQVRNADFP